MSQERVKPDASTGPYWLNELHLMQVLHLLPPVCQASIAFCTALVVGVTYSYN